MEEREVLKRLGFKEEKELASIEQLQDYNISYAEDDENYFNLSDKDGKKPEKIIESFLQYHRYLLPVFHFHSLLLLSFQLCIIIHCVLPECKPLPLVIFHKKPLFLAFFF